MKIIILLLFSSIAFADSINFGIYTDHSVQGDFNEQNNLIALEVNNNVFASFINSYGDQSYILAKQLMISNNLGFIAGLSHGYNLDCVINYCKPIGGYKKQLLPFGSLLITYRINKYILTINESLSFRTVSIGVNLN